MSRTIRDVIKEHGGRILAYRKKNHVFREPHEQLLQDYKFADDVAINEIRQLLKECEPGVVPDMDRLEENPKEMAEWGGYVEAVNQYTANIEKILNLTDSLPLNEEKRLG